MPLSKLKQEFLYPLLALAVFLVIARFFPPTWAFKHKPKPGDPVITILPPAPQLRLNDLNGQALNTASFKGKVVVVNFWAAWCTPCAEEVPQFIELQHRYQSQGLQIIGISIDDSDSELHNFYQRYKINYPVIAGDQNTAQAYGGILGLPTTLVINHDGFIEVKHVGATDFAALEKEVVALLRARAERR